MTQIVQEPETLIVRDCLVVLAHSMTQILQDSESLVVGRSVALTQIADGKGKEGRDLREQDGGRGGHLSDSMWHIQ